MTESAQVPAGGEAREAIPTGGEARESTPAGGEAQRTFELQPEEAALVAVQALLADRPGVLPTARGLSHFGEHSLGWMGAAALGAVLIPSRRRQFVTAGVGAFTAHAVSVVIKRVVRRRRPEHPAIAVGVGTPSRLSFPSSHATSSTAAALLLGRATGVPCGAALGAAAVVPPMLTSRLVLGVHYPTDVAAGAAIGAATAGLSVWGERLLAGRARGEWTDTGGQRSAWIGSGKATKGQRG